MPRIPFLQPTFHVTSTRRNITFGDCQSSAVGKPAGVHLSDPPGGRFRHAEEDAGPPCGHPASDSRALDGALPASGPTTATHRASAGEGKSAAALSAGQRLRRSNPLTPLFGATGCGAAGAARLPAAWARYHRGHVNAADFFEPEVPSTGGGHASVSCESSTWSAASLANEDSHRTPSSMFENID